MSKLKLAHTFQGNTGELLGPKEDYLLSKSDTKFFTVELNLYNQYEIREHSDLKSVLEFYRHHNLVYRFVEYQNSDGSLAILVLHNILFSDNIVGYQNFYGIGGHWKLYVNSKTDIVVQHMQFPKKSITVRFRTFSPNDEFYLDLSCLIYVVTNCKLETENEIRASFQKVKDRVTK